MAAGRNEHTHLTLWKICFLVDGEEHIQDQPLVKPASLIKAIGFCKRLNASYDNVYHFPMRVQ